MTAGEPAQQRADLLVVAPGVFVGALRVVFHAINGSPLRPPRPPLWSRRAVQAAAGAATSLSRSLAGSNSGSALTVTGCAAPSAHTLSAVPTSAWETGREPHRPLPPPGAP